MIGKAIAFVFTATLGAVFSLNSTWAQTPQTVRVALTLSTTTIPMRYAEKNGLFSKRGLEVKITQYADFDAVYTSARSGAADIVSGGPASIANLRNNGVPYRVAIGTSRMSNEILVTRNSPIREVKDLKGKAIGVFGGAAGTTSNMFMAVMIKQFGFDPRVDGKVVYGASGLLAGLLAKGDIAAFVSNDPVTSVELSSGRAVSLGELGEIYASQHGGYRPFAGSFSASDTFARQNPKGLELFLDAWKEAVSVFEKNPSLWSAGLKDILQIDEAGVADLMRQSIYFAPEWSQRNVQGEMEALEFMKATAGRGFLESIPKDTFVMPEKP